MHFGDVARNARTQLDHFSRLDTSGEFLPLDELAGLDGGEGDLRRRHTTVTGGWSGRFTAGRKEKRGDE